MNIMRKVAKKNEAVIRKLCTSIMMNWMRWLRMLCWKIFSLLGEIGNLSKMFVRLLLFWMLNYYYWMVINVKIDAV